MVAAAPGDGGGLTMWDAFQREALTAMGHTLLVPVAPRAIDAAVPAPSPPQASAAAAAPSALLRALALAAGIEGDIGRRVALPPLADLRTPLAKRDLWPRLRALRKMPPA